MSNFKYSGDGITQALGAIHPIIGAGSAAVQGDPGSRLSDAAGAGLGGFVGSAGGGVAGGMAGAGLGGLAGMGIAALMDDDVHAGVQYGAGIGSTAGALGGMILGGYHGTGAGLSGARALKQASQQQVYYVFKTAGLCR